MSATRVRGRGVEHRLTPGQHLREEIARIGLNQAAVCKATGVSRQTINNIINDRQAISRAMAGKLARVTGQSSDYWLRASFSSAPNVEEDSISNASTPPAGDRILVNYQITYAATPSALVPESGSSFRKIISAVPVWSKDSQKEES